MTDTFVWAQSIMNCVEIVLNVSALIADSFTGSAQNAKEKRLGSLIALVVSAMTCAKSTSEESMV